jgi:hypothetical protein
MPGLAPQGPHATIGVSIQPTTSGPGQAWVRYPGERALRRVAHSVWAVPSSGSIPRSQRMPRRRLSSRRSASWDTASCWISLGQLCAKSRPSAANCSTSLMVVVLTTPTISMKAAAFIVEALLARTRRTPGSLGPGIASGWRARALAPDREPVKDGRVGTGGRASPHSSRSTQRPGQRKSGTGHPQNHGDGIRTDGSHTLDLAMAPVCEGFTDSRQHILKIKVKVEPPGFSGGPGTHGAIHLLGSWSDDARRGRGGQACP